MKKSINSFLLIGFYAMGSVYASQPLLCPSVSTLKQAKLFQALQDPLDKDIWYFASYVFIQNNIEWNVWFGTFLPGVVDAKKALTDGQLLFQKVSVLQPYPIPYTNSRQITFCDFMPTGWSYWISTVHPPAFNQIPAV